MLFALRLPYGTKVNSLSKPYDLLIVDDDPLIREGLAISLGDEFKIYQAESRPAAIAILRKLPHPPQLALVDLGLPPTPHRPDEGFQLVAELLAHAPEIKIFVLSGQSELGNARHARAMGAIDFISKPCAPEKIKELFTDSLKINSPQNEPLSTLPPPTDEKLFRMVGQSARIKVLRDQILMYAALPFPVLIEGESGSGKELVANAIQANGPNPDSPYKVLNCAAIAPTLIEPTLFGYNKGAFTGASNAQSGFFEDASEGTLFLDEIGELPLELQTKLLRVLENGEYQRVGDTATRISSARIIAATNRNLRDSVRAGTFRSDLFHRLNVFPIAVPPLRELGQDKLLLLDHFRAYYAQQIRQEPFTLAPDALHLWEHYSFPGNNRELRNIVIRLATKYSGRTVDAAQLQEEFDPFETYATANTNSESTSIHAGSTAYSQEIHLESANDLLKSGEFNLNQYMHEQEAYFIGIALELSSGNISKAARMLGVNRTTLHSRMSGHEKYKQHSTQEEQL